MRCHECFHYYVCGATSNDTDADNCKQAVSYDFIRELENKLERVLKDKKDLEIELDYATSCINEVDDALYRGNHNDWAEQAIEKYFRRNSDSL